MHLTFQTFEKLLLPGAVVECMKSFIDLCVGYDRFKAIKLNKNINIAIISS